MKTDNVDNPISIEMINLNKLVFIPYSLPDDFSSLDSNEKIKLLFSSEVLFLLSKIFFDLS
jgi:hypothetical protein